MEESGNDFVDSYHHNVDDIANTATAQSVDRGGAGMVDGDSFSFTDAGHVWNNTNQVRMDPFQGTEPEREQSYHFTSTELNGWSSDQPLAPQDAGVYQTDHSSLGEYEPEELPPFTCPAMTVDEPLDNILEPDPMEWSNMFGNSGEHQFPSSRTQQEEGIIAGAEQPSQGGTPGGVILPQSDQPTDRGQPYSYTGAEIPHSRNEPWSTYSAARGSQETQSSDASFMESNGPDIPEPAVDYAYFNTPTTSYSNPGSYPYPSAGETLPVPSSTIQRTGSIATSQSSTSSVVSDPATCEICGSAFTGEYRRGNLSRHKRQKHGEEEQIYHCEEPGCGRSFKRQDARLKHHRRCHPNLLSAPIIPRPHHGGYRA